MDGQTNGGGGSAQIDLSLGESKPLTDLEMLQINALEMPNQV